MRRHGKWIQGLMAAMVAIFVTLGGVDDVAANEEALDTVREANGQYDEGDFRNALRLYREAYDELGDARLLYRIGLSYENIGNYSRAKEWLERYIAEDPDSPVKGRVEATIEQLGALEESIQAYLEIDSEPQGAEVYLHGYLGEPEGTSPATIPVGAGENLVTLIFPEGQRLEVTVDVGAGSTEEKFFQVGTASAPEEDSESEEVASAEMGDTERSDSEDQGEAEVDGEDQPAGDEEELSEADEDVIPMPDADDRERQQIRLDHVDAGPPWWATTLAIIGIGGGNLLVAYTGAMAAAGEPGPPWGATLAVSAVGVFGGIYLLGRNWQAQLPSIDKGTALDSSQGVVPQAKADFMIQWRHEF